MISKHSKTITSWVLFGVILGISTTVLTNIYLDARKALTPPVVSLMIVDGVTVHNWTAIDLNDGESVADIAQKVNTLDHFPIAWNGEKTERVLRSVNNGANGTWQYYVDQATPNVPLAKFYPKSGDHIMIIRTQ